MIATRHGTKMERAKPRIAFVTNIPAPYRLSLFRTLARSERYRVKFHFLAQSESNRQWHRPQGLDFDHQFLRGWSMPIRKRDGDTFTLHVNPGIVKELARGDYSAIVGSLDYSLTSILTAQAAEHAQAPFILFSEISEHTQSRKGRVLDRCRDIYKRALINRAKCFVATGGRAADYLRLHGAASPVFSSPYCVDSTFSDEALRLRPHTVGLKRQLGIAQRNVILFVGQLIARKRPLELLEVFAKVVRHRSDAALVYCGDGPLRSALEERVKRTGLSCVHIAGFKQQKDLARYFAVADFLVVPSAAETWAVVVNEALCCGLPVIATDYVGASEVLIRNGENGIVVARDDFDALERAVATLLDNDELRGRMSAAARETAQRFTVERASQGFLDAFDYATGTGRVEDESLVDTRAPVAAHADMPGESAWKRY